MKIYAKEWLIPYPMVIMKGRLLLSGINPTSAESIIKEVAASYESSKKWPTESELISELEEILESCDQRYRQNLDVVNAYYKYRREGNDVPPIILVLEGASATGKSMLLLRLIQVLGATRFMSTDSMRQVLRTQMSEEDYPELFCHTYQAHMFKQAGPEDLGTGVRGFLAQQQIIKPIVIQSIERVLSEGAETIIEGVHLVPGDFCRISEAVIEILIEPGEEMHRSMFMSKKSLAGLKTVVGASEKRENEFMLAREIQEYMLSKATESKTRVVNLESYAISAEEISLIILEKMKSLIG
jgi:2-phosphoglycerate kinase